MTVTYVSTCLHGDQRCKNSIHLHERLFEDPKIYTKNAWFATNSALSKVCDLRHFNTKKVEKQCETPGNSEKYQETVWNRVKQSQTETLLVSSCCHKHLTFIYTTLHNILHQDFYTSWEIFTRALLAPLAPFCISGVILAEWGHKGGSSWRGEEIERGSSWQSEDIEEGHPDEVRT